jgi:hypothetical protein
MAILGVAIVASIQGFAAGLRLLKLSGEHQHAMLVADQKLREPVTLEEGRETGTDGALTWERAISVVAMPELTAPAGTLPGVSSPLPGVTDSSTATTGSSRGLTGSSTGLTGSSRGLTGSSRGLTGSSRGLTGSSTGLTGSSTGATAPSTGAGGSLTGATGASTGASAARWAMYRIDVKVQWEKRSVELATLRTVPLDATGTPQTGTSPTETPQTGTSPTGTPLVSDPQVGVPQTGTTTRLPRR